jgi:polysaccharide export outer membrane protein
MTRHATLLCVLLIANGAYSQPLNSERPANSPAVNAQGPEEKLANLETSSGNADYLLGPGDQIGLVVQGLENEYNQKVFRIDASGDVTLPLVGRIRASGLSTAVLERELQVRLKPVLKDPQVVVKIEAFGSQPVSVLGAVRNPGILQLQGRKTLFEVLSMAGGLQPDAGYMVQVSRSLENGNIPLSTVQTDPTGKVRLASIRLKDIINIPKAAENIEILPGDTVSVPKAGMVYIVGSVAKPGGYPLDENESLSALQVLSLAEGLQSTAAASKAMILRPVPGSPRRAEIPVNLSRLMAGKATDLPLHADDILFVPGSKAKKAGLRTIDAIVNAATYSTAHVQ